MLCPQCGSQKGKRACPALHQTICPVCCGTKRQVSIRCPADCSYLAVARAHPPAATARQRERDFRFALPLVTKLPERALRLVFAFQDVIRRSRKTALTPLTDLEVVDAASALAATLETAARGIIYDHQVTSLSGQRLVQDLRVALAEIGKDEPGPGLEREAAVALRRVEEGARTAKRAFEGTAFDYLEFIERLPSELASTETGARIPEETSPAPRLIIP